MKNRNKTKYVIHVFFNDFTEKTFIRYSNKKNILNFYFNKFNNKYGQENIKLITSY
jgi:hypothetical protein